MKSPLLNSRYHEPWRGLPGEIRNAIWELSMCQPKNIILTPTPSIKGPNSPLRCSGKLGLEILEICREVHAVAERSLYRNNAFVLDGPCASAIDFLHSLPKHNLHFIKDIRFTETTVTDASASQEPCRDDPNINTLERLLQVLLDEMTLESVTLPIWREYGVVDDKWYGGLGAAVYQGRLPALRLHHRHGLPSERTLRGLADLYHAMEILTEYRFAVNDHVVWSLRKCFYDLSLGRDVTRACPPPETLKVLRAKLDAVLWFQMRLYAFTMGFETPDVGEMGLLVVMRYDLSGAKRRIGEFEDEVRKGYDYERESRDLFPLRLMSAEERLAGAKDSLARYEAMAEKGVWPVLDQSLWY